MNETELLALKTQIDKAKTAVNELNGQQNAFLKQLEEFGCKSLSEAETKLSIMEKDISALTFKIDQQTKELQEKYQLG